MRAHLRKLGRILTRSWWAFVCAGVAIVSTPLLAHHSYADYYLVSDTIEVEGEVVEFQYQNPHSWIHLVGQENFGERKTYAAEWANPTQLGRDGITKQTLHVGDSIRIWANPNRNPTDNRIRLRRIERRSDGWKWGQQGRRDSSR